MAKICKYWKIHWNTSPLCEDWGLYKNLKTISKEHFVEFWMQVGISYSESHIWANYASDNCRNYNNWSWIKWRKNDDWSIDKPKLPDSKGCYLYKFDSIEDYRESFANTLQQGYIERSCDTPECISRYYVKNDWAVKTKRSNRVRMFMNN